MTSTKNFPFDTVHGIGPKISHVLRERFPTFEALLDADPATLRDIKGGLSEATVKDLRQVAQSQIALGKLRGSAAATPPQAVEQIPGAKQEKLYVKTERRFPKDKHTVLRDLVPYTPALCEQCGLDLIRKNGFQPWDKCSGATQDLLRELMAEHKRIAHGVNHKILVTESERKQLANTGDEDDFGGVTA